MSGSDSNFGRKRDALKSFSRVGTGVQVQKLNPIVLEKFEDFSGGYVSYGAEQVIQRNSSPNMVDMLVDTKNRLRRIPGINGMENFIAYSPLSIATHADLDDSTDLLLFDPPYLGIKSGTGFVNWYNLALPAGDRWVSVNHGGELVFTNNVSTIFSRSQGATTITNLAWGPAATLGSFAGRVWAGAATIGGVYNPMGVMWTGSSGLVTDVSGPGSGYELLLSDMGEGDRIVAIRSIGFDLLVFVCRKSIWIGRKTGDDLRPLDFGTGRPGIGCVAEPTCKVTSEGVTYLSEAGVELFDGNSEEHISTAIDGDLLPIDLANIDNYSAAYSRVTKTYRLFTPSETWIYYIPQKRWVKSSSVVNRAVAMFNPYGLIGLPAGWGSYWSGGWGSPGSAASEYISDLIYLKDTSLGVDIDDSTSYFTVTQTPLWTSPAVDTVDMDEGFTFHALMLEYIGTPTVTLKVRDKSGDFTRSAVTAAVLLAAAVKRKREFNKLITGNGMAVQLTVDAGFPLISRIHIKGRKASKVADVP